MQFTCKGALADEPLIAYDRWLPDRSCSAHAA